MYKFRKEHIKADLILREEYMSIFWALKGKGILTMKDMKDGATISRGEKMPPLSLTKWGNLFNSGESDKLTEEQKIIALINKALINEVIASDDIDWLYVWIIMSMESEDQEYRLNLDNVKISEKEIKMIFKKILTEYYKKHGVKNADDIGKIQFKFLESLSLKNKENKSKD